MENVVVEFAVLDELIVGVVVVAGGLVDVVGRDVNFVIVDIEVALVLIVEIVVAVVVISDVDTDVVA